MSDRGSSAGMLRGLLLLTVVALISFGIALASCRAWDPDLAMRVSASAIGLAWAITCAAYALLMRASHRSAHALMGAIAAGMLLRLVALAGALTVVRFLPQLSGLPPAALPAFAVTLLAATLLFMAIEVALAAGQQRNPPPPVAAGEAAPATAHDISIDLAAQRATRPPESSPEQQQEQ